MATKKKRHRKTKAKKRRTTKRKTTAKKRPKGKRKPAGKKRGTTKKKPKTGAQSAGATRPIPPGIYGTWTVETVRLDPPTTTIGIQPQSKFGIEAGNNVRKKLAVDWNGGAATIKFGPIKVSDPSDAMFVLRAKHVTIGTEPDRYMIDLGLDAAGKLEIEATPEAGGNQGGGAGTAGRTG